MIIEVCLIVLSVTAISSVLATNLKLKQLENKINCLEDNCMDNLGEIKKNMEILEMKELNSRDILMEELNSNKEQMVKEINNLYGKLVFTPLKFEYAEKGESNGKINSNK